MNLLNLFTYHCEKEAISSQVRQDLQESHPCLEIVFKPEDSEIWVLVLILACRKGIHIVTTQKEKDSNINTTFKAYHQLELKSADPRFS